jgi:signal peptidase I
MTKPASQPPSESLLQTLASYCGTAITLVFVFTFVFQNFAIPSASMASTLLVGDHVVVDRASLAPPSAGPRLVPYRELRRGEPVVFYKPHPETPDLILVKRCIGVPGDHIHLQDGVVYVNGVAQKEPYAQQPRDDGDPWHALNPYRDDFPAISPENIPGVTATWTLDLPGHIRGEDLVVPPDSYFVMGDNRTRSLDSRYWGFVPRQNLIGRPLFIYWSFITPDDQMYKTSLAEEAGFTLHQIAHFLSDTRWNRTLRPVN